LTILVAGPYSVTEDVTPPGGGATPHIHDGENEMFYVLEGEYEFRYDDRLFKATKDSLVIPPREIPHSFKNTGYALGKTTPCSNTWWNGDRTCRRHD
jgi:mannose-6-phosphate isomerase-like protein (cupin superfamily)